MNTELTMELEDNQLNLIQIINHQTYLSQVKQPISNIQWSKYIKIVKPIEYINILFKDMITLSIQLIELLYISRINIDHRKVKWIQWQVMPKSMFVSWVFILFFWIYWEYGKHFGIENFSKTRRKGGSNQTRRCSQGASKFWGKPNIQR